jgi:hypothetical protein
MQMSEKNSRKGRKEDEEPFKIIETKVMESRGRRSVASFPSPSSTELFTHFK